jgi:Zn-dependent peptidase ImmA (M78 family)/DNA-binding XRE family transcriptional regulator
MIVNGERVKQARELKAMTQTALAKAIGVSQAAIAQIESGAFIASDELVEAIASRTSRPLQFFQQEPAPEFEIGSLLFRSHNAMSKKELVSTYRHAQIVYELWTKLKEGMRPIPIRIPKLPGSDPVLAAQAARNALSLPDQEPIPHLLNVLEWHGLVALVIPDVQSRDAFSLWYKDTPILALSSGRSGDRSRMTVAHELAHLTLHSGKSKFQVDDCEADDFAAEFLLPQSAMLKEIKTPVTLSSMASMKPRWRVSIQALIRRAKDLDVITDRQYRYLFEQLSSMGWRKAEPIEIVREKPRALRQMAEIRYGNPIDYSALSHDVSLDSAFLREILGAYEEKAAATEVKIDSRVISLSRRRS